MRPPINVRIFAVSEKHVSVLSKRWNFYALLLLDKGASSKSQILSQPLKTIN